MVGLLKRALSFVFCREEDEDHDVWFKEAFDTRQKYDHRCRDAGC